jgi:hypothetical protein
MVHVVPINDADRLQAEDEARMRTFAAAFAFGVPLIKALRQAGFQNPNKAMAARLLSSEYVKGEMEKNLEILRDRLLQSKEQVIAQLDEDREFAVMKENPAAAVAATVAKAKILGFMSTAAENSKNMPSKVVIEWGDESQETIYEKSNPLLFDAVAQTIEK